MTVQTIVSDVKGRVEPLVAIGQEVVTLSVDALLKANDVVVDGVQTVVKTQIEAGKDLLATFQSSFEKAKSAGFKAVAAAPIDYLPDGRERVVSAYNDTLTVVTKTSGEVVKIVKKGYATVSAKLSGAAVAKKAPAKKTARKAPAKKAATKKAA
ncbi:MAG: hypothetical protein JWQ90_4365 [Hydrocarboniphaga sp.]|uniref:phasin family protein n=1 Tax=Hydrocarboniphaga sp. TaxID=2033016 RepID=UPI002630D212|nr:phasin family protein [Hydrocarboniphaga sp.]MDB5971915.1 hypothetical protein [Hydrocarboniphaga sp.]